MSRGELIKHQQVDAVGTYTATVLDGSQQNDMLLEYAWSSYVSDASAANRLVSLIVLDENDDFFYHIHAFTAQVASKTNHYYWMPGIFRETTGSTAETASDANFQCPVPSRFIIPKGYTLKIADANGTDAGDVVTFKGMFSVLR